MLSPPAPSTSSPQQVLEGVLQSIPLFRSLHPSERAVLRASFELEQFHDGDVLSRGDSEASQLRPAHGTAADAVAGKEGGGDEIFVLVVGAAVVSVPLQPAPPAVPGAAGALRQPSAKWPSAASPLRRLHAGDFFIRDGLPCGSAVFARGPVHAYVLHPGVLRRLLHWFASARSLEESRHATSASSTGAAPASAGAADCSAGCSGSASALPGQGGAQQQALAKLHDGLLAATDRQAFCAALRRYRHVLHGMPLPCERERSVKALHRDTDQAFRDLAREHAFLLNGTQISLGSGEHVLGLLERLADAIRLQLQGDQGFMAQLAAYATSDAAAEATAPPQEHKSSEASGESVAPAVGGATDSPASQQSAAAAAALEDVVSAVLSDVLIASSRTMTGGDSYSQCHSLFSNPGLVFIAAETGTQAPVDVILRGSHVSIQSVNTYKVCHMATDEEAAADAAARRSQRSSRASSPGGDGSDSDGDDTGRTDSRRVRRSDSSRLAEDGSMQVWALLRASITEVIHYAPGAPVPRGQRRPSQRDQGSTDGALVPSGGANVPAGSAAVAAWKRAMAATAGGSGAPAGAASGARGPRASFMSSVSASLGTYAFNLLHRQEKGKVLAIAAAVGGDGGGAPVAGDDAQAGEGLAVIDEGGPTDDGEATPPPAAPSLPRAGQPPIIVEAGELDTAAAAAASELMASASTGRSGAAPSIAAVQGEEELSAGGTDSDADGRAITKRASTHLRQLSRTGDACGWSKVVQQELLSADAASAAPGASGIHGESAGHVSSSSAQETLLTPGALLGAMPAVAAGDGPASAAESAPALDSCAAAAEARPEVDAQIATFAFSQFTSESGSSSAPETALSAAVAVAADVADELSIVIERALEVTVHVLE